MRWWMRTAVGLFVGVVASHGLHAEEPVFDVPYLSDIEVDGDPSEWGSRGFGVFLLGNVEREFKAPDDFRPRFWLGWNERGLLLRVDVHDDVFIEHGNKYFFWSRDAIEIFVAPERGSLDRYQPIISPGCADDQPEVRYNLYDYRMSDELVGRPLSIDVARTKSATGYALEACLPWANLGITPKMGEHCAFQIYLNDYDDLAGGVEPYFPAVWYPAIGSHNDTRKMYTLRLAEAPSAVVRSLAVVRRYTQMPLAWIEINATEDQVGRPYAISGEFSETATGTLVAEQGRAVARCYVTMHDVSAAEVPFQVLVDEKPVANVANQEASFPELDFVITESDAETNIQLVAKPLGNLPATKKAVVECLDADGRRIAKKRRALGDPIMLDLTPGDYLLTARQSDVLDLEVRGSRGFSIGPRRDRTARLAELTERVVTVRGTLIPEHDDAYHAWFVYVLERLAAAHENADAELFATCDATMVELLIRAQAHPEWLRERRGVFEWAHWSAVDGSAQPFSMIVPSAYDPECAWPLLVSLHGAGGTHRVKKDKASFDEVLVACPMARAVAGGYAGFAEQDVFEVMAFVERHWHVDPERVHLTGGSMGGGGTYELASRHPDRFASARPQAGGGLHCPLPNLLHVPTYAIHGTDDWQVPLGPDSASIAGVSQFGGAAVLDPSENTGHNVDPRDFAHSHTWAMRQRRVSRPRRVRYEAENGLGTRAYWAYVDEWGPEGASAVLDLRLAPDNSLYADIDNATVVRLELAQSPACLARDMEVFVNARCVGTVNAPLPERLFLIHDGSAWVSSREAPAQPPFRLHTPGGPWLLYGGEPLLVVWGTQGDEAANTAMDAIAQMTRRCIRPGWPEQANAELALMTHGMLPGKPDEEVTPEDMERFNLFLIGTARQNSVVAELAERLPVRVHDHAVLTDDGQSWSFADRALALLYRNPVSPERLVYWAASESAEFYSPGNVPMNLLSWNVRPPDFCLMSATTSRIVAARRFDSRWQWEQGYAASPLLPEHTCTQDGYQALFDSALLRCTGADALITERVDERFSLCFAAGETRHMDVLAVSVNMRLVSGTISGGELLRAEHLLGEAESSIRLHKHPDGVPFHPALDYHVVTLPWHFGNYCRATRTNPESFRPSDVAASEAVARAMTPRAGAKAHDPE